ncbi:hypothetical protein [Aestuariispira insulae]|nr:hypothetical protein [Aestuariispira insulae]
MILVPLAMLGACASQPGEFSGRSKTTILVMADDSDPTTLARSNSTHYRVNAGLKGAMSRQGFRLLDENFAEAQLGWRFHDRQPESDLIQAAKLMRQSGQANLQPEILVLYRLHSRHRDNGYATVVRTRLAGAIFDIAGNRFLDEFELPVAEYSAPADCNQRCMDRVVGSKAKDISNRLGTVLGRKLAAYSPGGKDRKYEDDRDDFDNEDSFKLTLEGFNSEESREIIRVMTNEFPGYQDLELISRNRTTRLYRYDSKASRAKLEKWIVILLSDMGFNPDHEVDITVAGNRISVTRLDILDPYPPKKKQNKKSPRFQ